MKNFDEKLRDAVSSWDDDDDQEPTKKEIQEQCPTCQGRIWNVKRGKWVAVRETRGLVCEACGRDYYVSDHKDEDGI